MKKILRHVPNTITCCNLIAGVLASIYALKFDQQAGGLFAYQWAFIWIGVAAVCDFLDGFAARGLKAYSELGKQLDSLSDLVSFGVAPAMLVYSLLSHVEGAQWMAYLALMIPVCGALRLARFNIDDRQTTSFIGLPIPANAIFWIGAVAWAIRQATTNPDYQRVTIWIVMLCVIFVSLLMVSNLHMFSLKFHNLDWRENLRRYVVIVGAVLFVVFCGLPGLAWTIILYLILSVLPERQ